MKAIFQISGPLMIGAILAVGSFAYASPSLGPQDDLETVEFIEMDFAGDSQLASVDAKVKVRDGIVILNGSVATIDQSERAAERAMAMIHVRAVVNELGVKPQEISDAALAAKVRNELEGNKAMDARGIEVSCNSGKIILSGSVGSWDEREIARESASKVPGVQIIENRTEIVYGSTRTDEQIEEQLRQMIGNDPLCDGLSLAVSVKEGIVRLKGKLGSKGEYERLVRRSSVTGVFEVNADRLSIDPSLRMEEMEDKHFSPEQMVKAFDDAVKMDSRVESERINRRLEDGVITLSGAVPSDGMRAAAESTARGVPGILAVNNEIVVVSPKPLVSASAPLVAPPR